MNLCAVVAPTGEVMHWTCSDSIAGAMLLAFRTEWAWMWAYALEQGYTLRWITDD